MLSAGISTAQIADYSFQHQQGLYTPLHSIPNTSFTEHVINDDFVSPEKIKMPFAFKFDSYQPDSIGISENAFVWFGNAKGTDFSATNPISSQLPASVKGVISALGIDLHPHISTNLTSRIRTAVLGTAPHRFFVVEWQNTSRYETVGGNEDTMSFQVKLYETTNKVEIVFGHFGINSTMTSNAEVGLKGTSLNDFNNRVVSAMDWSASTPGSTAARRSVLRKTIRPSMGQLFVWTPPLPNAISDVSNEQDLVLFPIPATSVLKIKGENYTGLVYKVFDVQGAVVGEGYIQSNTIQIAHLATGYYTLEINDRNRIIRKDFVK
jgi:hypothetical protein